MARKNKYRIISNKGRVFTYHRTKKGAKEMLERVRRHSRTSRWRIEEL